MTRGPKAASVGLTAEARQRCSAWFEAGVPGRLR